MTKGTGRELINLKSFIIKLETKTNTTGNEKESGKTHKLQGNQNIINRLETKPVKF